MTSARKLLEASFFIELLQALEERSEPLTYINDFKAEVSFVYAAALNAFYSVVEIMRKEGFDTREFKQKYPEIYADGSKGGERAKTVHIAHTEPSKAGYIPSSGKEVNIVFRPPAKLSSIKRESTPGKADLIFRPRYYFYIEILGKEVHALEFLESHLIELSNYHKSTTKL